MLLYERVFAMERDGVEIKVEGAASLQAKFLHGVEPRPHDLWVADRSDAAAVLREEGTLWNGSSNKY